MEILGYILALAIGILMGLLGGGGSILTIPVFVYLLNISPGLAAAYSLFVIGSTSFVGAIKNLAAKNVDLKSALIFGLPSFTAVFLTTRFFLPLVPVELFTLGEFTLMRGKAMMIVFSMLLVIAGFLMFRKKPVQSEDEESAPLYQIGLQGVLIGFLAGLVGVGGGFLIIPALVLMAKIPMKKAVGTTLVIIAFNSILGFLGHLNNYRMDWSFLIPFAALSITGILIGIYLTKFLSSKVLRKGFAYFVFIMAGFILIKELFG